MVKIKEYDSDIIREAMENIPLKNELFVYFHGYWLDRTPPEKDDEYSDQDWNTATKFAQEMMEIVTNSMEEYGYDINIQRKDVKKG